MAFEVEAERPGAYVAQQPSGDDAERGHEHRFEHDRAKDIAGTSAKRAHDGEVAAAHLDGHVEADHDGQRRHDYDEKRDGHENRLHGR